MSKLKYFAKWLVVEGEMKNLKKGEWFELLKDGNGVRPIEGNKYWRRELDDDKWNPNSENFRRVKLFLCSRDIKVGDEFQTTEVDIQEVKFCAHKITTYDIEAADSRSRAGYTLFSKNICFKVIGEIDSKGTYIKENQEFEEEELYFEGGFQGFYYEGFNGKVQIRGLWK